MFTTLRVYALSNKNRHLGVVALVLSMAPFVINMATVYQELPLNFPPPLNCQEMDTSSTNLFIGLVVISRTCLILADTLAVAVTWRQTRAATRLTTATRNRMSLDHVMLENGSVYFCTLVSMNVVDLVLVITSRAIGLSGFGPSSSYINIFIDPVSSILNSRFLLALHETNARMAGTSTSISSLSLDINSGGDLTGNGSPELSYFLQPFGGSIHSFHDDGEVESLQFAPRSEGEHEPEENAKEAEVEESGAGGNLA